MSRVSFLKSKKIVALKRYFKKNSSVILAFVFGSYAQGFEMKESDFDVAVYLKNRNLSPGQREKIEDNIWLAISKITRKNVDLVCLNIAPVPLISSVFKTGTPLVIKDKKLYWELYLRMSTEAEDFLEFVEDFWRIKQKTKSLGR